VVADHAADVGAQGVAHARDPLPNSSVVGQKGVDLGGALRREPGVDQRVEVARISGQGSPVHGDDVEVAG